MDWSFSRVTWALIGILMAIVLIPVIIVGVNFISDQNAALNFDRSWDYLQDLGYTAYAQAPAGDWNVTGDAVIGGDLTVTGSITGFGALPAAQELTIDGVTGGVAPAAVPGPYVVIELTGDGGGADDLELVTIPVTEQGKLVIFKLGPASGTITIKSGGPSLITSTDLTLDTLADRAVFEVTAADTLVKWFNSSNP